MLENITSHNGMYESITFPLPVILFHHKKYSDFWT